MKTVSVFKNNKQKSFTLIEIVIILGILTVIIFMAIPAFRVFQKNSDLKSKAAEIAGSLRLAQNKTTASQDSYQYGIYFDQSTDPDKYMLFRGSSFMAKDPSFEKNYNLPQEIEFFEIDLWGGNEVIFEKLTGYASSASSYGKISLRLKNDPSKTESIYIENSGSVSFTQPLTYSDMGRITDSRHIHFEYGRDINTSTEKITLNFSGTTQEIPIIDNYINDQIYWEGEVDVAGVFQKIKIHTHRINDFGTQFCVHRDRRYNDKALVISLDGDITGSLIEYYDDGQEFRGTSIHLVPGEEGDPYRQ